jgi:hypothetical protein
VHISQIHKKKSNFCNLKTFCRIFEEKQQSASASSVSGCSAVTLRRKFKKAEHAYEYFCACHLGRNLLPGTFIDILFTSVALPVGSALAGKAVESVNAGAAISAGVHGACVKHQLILQCLQASNQLIHLKIEILSL